MTEDLIEEEMLKWLNGETQVDPETCLISSMADMEEIMHGLPESILSGTTLKEKTRHWQVC
jgi:hypothetical protein